MLFAAGRSIRLHELLMGRGDAPERVLDGLARAGRPFVPHFLDRCRPMDVALNNNTPLTAAGERSTCAIGPFFR